MIFENIKIFSQNFHKNNLIINTILKTCLVFDIFIQEPSWTCIYSILSSLNGEDKELVGVPNYFN